jgi:hypothetical protein
MKKVVNFSFAETRYYPITIGDNPSTDHGLPLTIDWDHIVDETDVQDISVYDSVTEMMKEPKAEHEMILQPIDRLKMLRQVGYTFDELKMALSRLGSSSSNNNNGSSSSGGS